MANLKKQLIKLGSESPELREHLRPILDHLQLRTSSLYDTKVAVRRPRTDHDNVDRSWLRKKGPDHHKDDLDYSKHQDELKPVAAKIIKEMESRGWKVSEIHKMYKERSPSRFLGIAMLFYLREPDTFCDVDIYWATNNTDSYYIDGDAYYGSGREKIRDLNPKVLAEEITQKALGNTQ